MHSEHEQLTQNVAAIRQRIQNACIACGRNPADVLLCAASKTRSAQTVEAAQGIGIDIFGENRVQELVEKHAANAYGSVPLHFIGHLQTNKVRQVVGTADLIESVDSERLLLAIEKEAAKQDICQPILLEVNIGKEESKGGIAPDQLISLIQTADRLEHVQVMGLMCIPPRCETVCEQRSWFAKMRTLFEQAAQMPWNRVQMKVLSMGMSNDFEAAIQEGATIVRVGTAIFGPRNYSASI